MAAPSDSGNSLTGINGKILNGMLGECVPNPAENESSIAYSLPENIGNAQIRIFVAGTDREVMALKLELGSEKIAIPTAQIPPGIFIVKLLLDNGLAATRKLVIVK